MRRSIWAFVACAALLLAIGSSPRYLEELRVGGGYASAPDGGADFEADGDIRTDGDLIVDGDVAVGGALSAATAVTDQSLTGHWPLDDGAGTMAHDLGYSGSNGTITAGSGGWGEDSPLRGSYLFSSSRIECGTAAGLDSLGPQTICAWIKPTGWGGSGAGNIVSKNDAAAVSDAFYVASAENSLRFVRRFATSGSGRWRSATNSIALNRWQFVAVTYDHSSASNDPVFYVNGQVSATTEVGAPSGAPLHYATEPLIIGNAKSLAYPYAGWIADVRVYERVLSARELQALYRAPSESPTFQALTTTGNATLGGDVTVSGGDVLAGADGTMRGVMTLWDGSGGNAPGSIKLGSPNGTLWYLFVRDDGTLKVHSALPTANGDGVVVGTQY